MKRDAKVELIRTKISHEIQLLEAGVRPPTGRTVNPENRPAVIYGLRRAIELLDKVDEETR